jgi:hypothetical protein
VGRIRSAGRQSVIAGLNDRGAGVLFPVGSRDAYLLHEAHPGSNIMGNGGHVLAQAVSSQLPTAVARVRARVWTCGICGGQSGTGHVFSE